MSDKLVISPPSNFEHTVHVGFDPHTGEFTVSEHNLFVCLFVHRQNTDIQRKFNLQHNMNRKFKAN